MRKLFFIVSIQLLTFNLFSQNMQTEFHGGAPKLYEYINKNLKFPQDAKAKGVSGKVFIEFYVNTDGTIDEESVKIVKSLHKSCDAEAIRLIKNSPKWKPALEGGKPVKQKFVMPITFI